MVCPILSATGFISLEQLQELDPFAAVFMLTDVSKGVFLWVSVASNNSLRSVQIALIYLSIYTLPWKTLKRHYIILSVLRRGFRQMSVLSL